MADKKISELDQTLNLSDQADFPLSQDNGGEPTTFRAKLTQIATKIAEAITFSNLKTGNKQLVSAVNQTISNLADDFNTTAGSTYAKDDCVLYNGVLYQCINNSGTTSGTFIVADWTEIKAVDVGSGGGGGGGTTDYEDLSNKPQVNSVELVGNKSLDDLGIMPASLSKTVSGSIAHFTDGADNIPIKSLVSQIVAVESGSGEKSPDNPYTISGFASGVVSVCGVNVWDEQLELGYYSSTGAKVSATNQLRTVNKIMAKPSTAYYFKIPVSDYNAFAVIEYDVNGEFLRRVTPSSYSGDGAIYTTSSDCHYFNINIGSSYGNVYLNNISINYPSTDTSYHAYNGNTYTFTFGQTVFGGYFDNKGNLVVTHGYIASYNGETINEPWISSMDEYVPNTSPSTGAQVVYPLTTPITLAITSQDIPTLLGENNIYSNCGDVEVNYYINNSDDIVDLIKSVGTGGFQPVIYSEEEREIGVWKDGKPLYQKTVDCGTLPNASGIQVAHNISNLADVVCIFGYAVNSSYTSIPLPYPDTVREYNVNVSVDTTYISISTGRDRTQFTGYITIQYTKTTDVAGSGQWTPQGVPAHHYSTDEQVVGTWIDGSTLYEKTFVMDNQLEVSYTSWTSTGITADYISAIFGAEMFGVSNYQGGALANIQNSVIQLQALRNSNAFPKSFVLCYTKSST